jgi:hypothetical protein
MSYASTTGRTTAAKRLAAQGAECAEEVEVGAEGVGQAVAAAVSRICRI